MTQTPAGWFPDPHDQSQFRYWDGTTWTEHRAPRSTTTDQLNKAGNDLAEGLAKGFTAVGNWVQKNAAASPSQPTFASVAAACRDEPARHPLSKTVEAVLDPTEVAAVAQLFASTGTTVTPEGSTLENEVCRLVPNPWNPQDPTGVAILVGMRQVGRLPGEVSAAYSAPLTQLTQRQLLATGTASIWAQGSGTVAAARVTVQIPEASAFDEG
jgi:hypothetical protein